MTPNRTKQADSNYQALAAEFSVGDLATPWGTLGDFSGRVVAVYPAIGMVDIQFPHGNARYPVEDLQRFHPEQSSVAPMMHDTIPGGASTVITETLAPEYQPTKEATQRLASKFLAQHPTATPIAKQAVYWVGKDRKYRATESERDSGVYMCPKCKTVPLRRASYQRTDGNSVKLLGCSECMFLVRPADLEGCHHADNLVGTPVLSETEQYLSALPVGG